MIDKLIDKIIKTNNPIVVGLDPRLSFIPDKIKNEKFELFGETRKAVAECFLDFNKGIIDSIKDIVPAVKPQIAMYEEWGFEGVKAYFDTVEYAKQNDLIVIGDIKRGDIASSAVSYSNGHIGRARIGGKNIKVFDQDFITINPFLGSDSIEPFIKDCKEYKKGIFVLLKTSNKGSGELQNLELKNGNKLYEELAFMLEGLGKDLIGKYNYSSIAAVVGATKKEEAENLRGMIKKTFFLVPGYGAQGASAGDVKVNFDKDGLGAIINSSRGIIANHINNPKFTKEEYKEAAREAALNMQKDLGFTY